MSDVRSIAHFGTILNVRPLASGKLLVNDGEHRQLVIIDEKLAGGTVIIDSVAVGAQSYGATAARTPDYWPPVREGAMKDDLGNNAWILPTTPTQSRNGGLVYDVVNNR